MDSELVGRENELAAAEPFLDDVRSGVCALVLEGEAGIGKTSVWRALTGRAAERGYRVLACQAEEAEARLSFVGLSDLLGEAELEVLPSLTATQRHALAVALLREPPQAGSAPDARTVAVAFTSLLAELACPCPLVLAVDDLQWLDSPTAQVLTFALRRLSGHRVGLLATWRTPRSAADPLGLERALGERLACQRLGPLSPSAVGSLLDRRLGRRYARPTLGRIVTASGGNPLFALEIARALGASPSVDPGARLPVPDSLRELVAGRIPELAPQARDALLAAAALSHPTIELIEQAVSAEGLAAAEESGLASERLRLQAGDFFRDPLPVCDAYLLMDISHDWGDEQALQILQAVRRVAPTHARLLVIESLIPDDPGPNWAKVLDVLMLTALGGRQRTEREYADLLAAAGFQLEQVIPTFANVSVPDATPRAVGPVADMGVHGRAFLSVTC